MSGDIGATEWRHLKGPETLVITEFYVGVSTVSTTFPYVKVLITIH